MNTSVVTIVRPTRPSLKVGDIGEIKKVVGNKYVRLIMLTGKLINRQVVVRQEDCGEIAEVL